MKAKLRYAVAGFMGRQLLNAILGTVRFKVMTEQPHLDIIGKGGTAIWALWHGRLLPLAYFHRHQQLTVMISRSGDGEYIAKTVSGWGFEAARGSSSKGGSSALREMVKIARRGGSLVLTADGPRGPRQEVKPGVLTAAQLTGLPILPATAAATRSWWFKSWDRFLVPKPWSTVYLRYAAPMYVDRSASEPDLESLRLQLQNTLNEMTAQADVDAQT
jgi:lysophospholipid acyltransferase (LPLAT)-like uncharacterized protein